MGNRINDIFYVKNFIYGGIRTVHVFDIFVVIGKIKCLSQSGSNNFCPVLRQSALLITDNPLHLGLFVPITILLEVVTARL